MNLVQALMKRLEGEYLAQQLKEQFGVSASLDLLYKEMNGKDPGEGFFRAVFEYAIEHDGPVVIKCGPMDDIVMENTEDVRAFLIKFRANHFSGDQTVRHQVTTIVRAQLEQFADWVRSEFALAVAVTVDGKHIVRTALVRVINPNGEGYTIDVDVGLFTKNNNKILLASPLGKFGTNKHGQGNGDEGEGHLVFTTPAEYVPIPFAELQVNKLMTQRF